MKGVLILSRGVRLAPIFRAMARELAREHEVVVAINTVFPGEETAFWRDAPGVTVIDFAAAMERSLRKIQGSPTDLLRQIESLTGLPLYKSTSNYQLYRRLYESYFGHWPWGSYYAVEKDIIREYVGSYLVLSEILDRYEVDVVFYEAIDLISTYLALALAYQRGTFAFGIYFAAAVGDGKVFLQYGVHRRNILLEHLYAHPHLISAESRAAAARLLTQLEQDAWEEMSVIRSYKQRTEAPFLRSPLRLLGTALSPRTWLHPRQAVRGLQNKVWLARHLHKTPPPEPFLAFLLHHQPEASLCSAAPRWVDQDRIVEQLAINAPYGLKIAVKENPITYGARGKVYFGPLASLPNVYLCHPAVDSYDLARRAEAVLTVTGSIGIEAALLGRRVAVLGRPYYACFEGVRRLDRPEEIFDALQDSSWDPKSLAEERRRFAAAYVESVCEIGPVEPGRKWPAPDVAGAGLAQALRRTMAFVERHSLAPANFDPGMRT